MREAIVVMGAVLLAGCGGEQAPVQNQTEEAASLSPGQYQAQWKVASLRSTDRTDPKTNLKVDATGTSTACVTADSVDPLLFAEDGDTCTVANPYLRNGRLAMDLTCTRKGVAGEVRQSVSGSFTADGLEAEVSTSTYLGGGGNYAMSRTFTAKRLGECPPAAAKPPEKKG